MRFTAIAASLSLALAAAPSCHHAQSLPGSDADTDSDSETETDPGPSDPACAMLYAGECTGLVAGCAACPDGDAPFAELADCQPDEWCCVPAPEPGNPCEQAGGVCVPLTEDDGGCPTGWWTVDVECDGLGAMCCMSAPACA
jgi:hypothetical protein